MFFKDLLKNGNKTEAKRVIQNQLKIGLKNSKDFVDALELAERAQIAKNIFP